MKYLTAEGLERNNFRPKMTICVTITRPVLPWMICLAYHSLNKDSSSGIVVNGNVSVVLNIFNKNARVWEVVSILLDK